MHFENFGQKFQSRRRIGAMGGRFALVVLVALVGCSSQASDDRGRGGKQLGIGGGDGYDYPSGPYGTEVGSVVADLQLWGRLRHEATGLATSAELGSLSFGSIRQSTDKTHALIHVSGFT